MSNCTSGCPTQDHATYGQCLRSKGVIVNGIEATGGDRSAQKKWDKELNLYREARTGGLQPSSTKTKDTIRAMEAVS